MPKAQDAFNVAYWLGHAARANKVLGATRGDNVDYHLRVALQRLIWDNNLDDPYLQSAYDAGFAGEPHPDNNKPQAAGWITDREDLAVDTEIGRVDIGAYHLGRARRILKNDRVRRNIYDAMHNLNASFDDNTEIQSAMWAAYSRGDADAQTGRSTTWIRDEPTPTRQPLPKTKPVYASKLEPGMRRIMAIYPFGDDDDDSNDIDSPLRTRLLTVAFIEQRGNKVLVFYRERLIPEYFGLGDKVAVLDEG